MFENLESRAFMSVTFPAADGLVLDAAAQPSTSVDSTAPTTAAKPKPSPAPFTFTHLYDKASPVLA
jgi:hypothetical protein